MQMVWIFLAGILLTEMAHAQGGMERRPVTPPEFGDNPHAYVRFGSDRKTWTIGNDFVEREIRFDPNIGLYTMRWQHKSTGTDFVRRPPDYPFAHRAAEFSFEVDGETFRGARSGSPDFDLLAGGLGEISPPGKKLTVLLEARKKPLRVEVHYAVYEGHPVIRKWIEIWNMAEGPITISHLSFEDVNLAAGAPAELEVSGFYGSQPREIFFTGRVDDPMILERNPRTGEGFAVLNEAPGYLKRTEMVNWGEGVRVMYDTDLFPFERRIEPRQQFTSAKSSIACFVEGIGMADPHWVVPSYTAEVLMRGGSPYQPPWIYNTWIPFLRGINAKIVGDSIPIAGRMRLDIFTIDDGWQSEYGENAVNLTAFPHGLDEVGLLTGKNNMRLGLWVPLAAIGTRTRVFREHPEWLSKDANGEAKFTMTAAGSQAVMCMATPYRDYAARRLNELIAQYHLKYVKIDLTTVFNTYGEAPGCYAQGHDHRTWAESLERIYEGIQHVTESIYREHPDVLLDLTFELWGQKHLIDYGLLGAGDLDWLSNVDDQTPQSAGPRQARTLLYHRARAIPTESMLIGNLLANTRPIEERFATAIGSGPLLLGDLRQLTPAEVNWYGEKVRWFKNLRARVPINQSFFPLGAWTQPRPSAWDGFARLSRDGRGIVAIFKNESGAETVDLRIPAFPDGSFLFRSVITGRSLGPFSGEKFKHGITLKLPDDHQVEILEIRR